MKNNEHVIALICRQYCTSWIKIFVDNNNIMASNLELM